MRVEALKTWADARVGRQEAEKIELETGGWSWSAQGVSHGVRRCMWSTSNRQRAHATLVIIIPHAY